MASIMSALGQQQEILVDAEKASELRSVLISQGMEHLLGESKNSSIECMRLQAYFHYGADGQFNNLRPSSLILTKSEAPCRYFTMPGGCVRGDKCMFSHPTAEIMSMEMGQSFMAKQVGGTKRIGAEDLRKKIFVGGLSPSVESEVATGETLRHSSVVFGRKSRSHAHRSRDHSSLCVAFKSLTEITRVKNKASVEINSLFKSLQSVFDIECVDDLWEFFEVNYGPVLDAVVIGSQAGDQMQSRGFGFVTFKHAASVSAAVEAHYINIYGKKVEIKGAVPRSELPVPLEVSRADSDNLNDSQTAISPNKVLDLDEADVLEVATPGSLCLPTNELSQSNRMNSMAEPQQVRPSESAPSSLSGPPTSWVSNVSNESSISQSVTREASSESSSSTSHGPPSAHVSSVSHDTCSQSVMRAGSSSNIVQERKPAWLNTFEEWLPEFLTRVSMRLKEGEWYPLSSLKGDYRAICGLELDHVSLGFEKLSDFVRSFPELCRMKIVPVGRGPATHMVLLPPHSRTNPSVASRRSLSNITARSLVDGTRSYAEVACHGSAARLGRPDTVPSSNPAFYRGGSNQLIRQGTHAAVPSSAGGITSSSTDRQPPISCSIRRGLPSREIRGPSASYAAAAGYNAGLISTSNGPLRTSTIHSEGHSGSDLSNGTTGASNSSSSNRSCRSASHVRSDHTEDSDTMSAGGEMSSSDVNSGLSKEDLGLLQELISRLKKTGMEHLRAGNHGATGSSQPALVTMHDALSPPRCKAPPGYQASPKPMKKIDNEKERSRYFPFFDQEPKTPTSQNHPPTTPFNHPFAGFLPENFPPSSSMWGQDLNSNRIKEGGYGIQGRTIESFDPSCQFYEDSPLSNDSIYGTPRGYLSASSSPGQGYPKTAGTCEICFERQALWVAVPCGHKNMCSVCKGSLRQGNQATAQCLVCTGYVERWIALH